MKCALSRWCASMPRAVSKRPLSVGAPVHMFWQQTLPLTNRELQSGPVVTLEVPTEKKKLVRRRLIQRSLNISDGNWLLRRMHVCNQFCCLSPIYAQCAITLLSVSENLSGSSDPHSFLIVCFIYIRFQILFLILLSQSHVYGASFQPSRLLLVRHPLQTFLLHLHTFHLALLHPVVHRNRSNRCAKLRVPREPLVHCLLSVQSICCQFHTFMFCTFCNRYIRFTYFYSSDSSHSFML